MSETATSLQDVRLRRESREPALPLDWISVGHEEEKGGGGYSSVQIYEQPKRLAHWFIFLI